MDSISELAKMLKERENNVQSGITTGIVLSTLPDIKVKLNDVIILNKNHLILSDNVYYKSLVSGDEVILIPTKDEQTYYLLDKAVTL